MVAVWRGAFDYKLVEAGKAPGKNQEAAGILGPPRRTTVPSGDIASALTRPEARIEKKERRSRNPSPHLDFGLLRLRTGCRLGAVARTARFRVARLRTGRGESVSFRTSD